MYSEIDWGVVLEDLVRRELGEPNRSLSDLRVGDLRYGRRGSLSVKVPPHPRAGAWYDHEAGVGGGVSELRLHLGLAAGGGPLAGGGGDGRARPEVRPGVVVAPGPVSREDVGRLWGLGERIPVEGGHAVRRWLGARWLWRKEVGVPGCLRWRPGGGVGQLLALAAPPGEWVASWPGVPDASALQRIPVCADGSAGGLKKSLGGMSGCVMVIGVPGGSEGASVLVCEGVADGLALAARSEATVVVVFGTSGMENASRSGLAGYLAGFEGGVEVWADRDGAGDRGRRAPAGGRAGYALRRAVLAEGGRAEVWHAGGGWKDVADWAAGMGFLEVDVELRGVVGAELKSLHREWPDWQLARVAAIRGEGGKG